jgi:hypothetical protein
VLFLLASILLLGWIVALAFKVTFAAIHVLVIVALALYLWGFLRGRTRAPAGPGV